MTCSFSYIHFLIQVDVNKTFVTSFSKVNSLDLKKDFCAACFPRKKPV